MNTYKRLAGPLFVLAISMLTACGPKELNLTTATPNVTFDETAQTDSVIINGSDGNCEIEYAPQWVAVEVKDSVVVLKTKENTSGKVNKDVLVVKCGASNITLNLEQGIKATHLDLPNGKEIKFDKEGGSKDLVVVTDGSVKVEAFDGVTADYKNGKLTVTTPKNEGNRTKGTIKLIAGDFTKEVEVSIDGKFCTTCNGTGKVKCKSCGGAGSVFREEPYMGIYGCKSCGGRGYAYRVADPDYRDGSGKQTCPTCKGKGV